MEKETEKKRYRQTDTHTYTHTHTLAHRLIPVGIRGLTQTEKSFTQKRACQVIAGNS